MIVLTLARKPLIGSVAANVLKHGAGGLNITGCRISLEKGEPRVTQGYKHLASSDYSPGTGKDNALGSQQDLYKQAGRWPANLILCHLSGCRKVGTIQISGVSGGGMHRDGKGCVWGKQVGHPQSKKVGFSDESGMETVDAWDCQSGCPVASLDQQSGFLHGAGNLGGTPKTAMGYCGNWPQKIMPHSFDHGGGASRFFKQIQPQGDAK